MAPADEQFGNLDFDGQPNDGDSSHVAVQLDSSAQAPRFPLAAASTPSQQVRPAFVYALGRIEPRFPSLGLEKEFAQATGRAEAGGLTDREAVRSLLADRANRYLARRLTWVLT